MADKVTTLNWAYVIQANGTSKALTLKDDDNLPEHLAEQLEALADGAYLWAHLSYDTELASQILLKLGLTEDDIEGLVTTESRPKALSIRGAWLIAMRAINKNTESHPEQMISVRLWVTPQLLISLRRSTFPLFSIRDLKTMVDEQQAPSTTMNAVLYLLDFLTDRVRDSVDQLEDTVTTLEEDILGGKFSAARSILSTKRRESAGIRRFLAPQREALENLARYKGAGRQLNSDENFWVRDLIERTTRYIEDLDLVREKAVVLQEDMRATIGDQQNQRMYVLSIVTAVFLPLSFLTGVFGMNVAGLPGTEMPSAFWILFGCMSFLAVGIGCLMYKKQWF